MRAWIGFAVLGMGLLACSNDDDKGDDEGGGGCADVSGNYDVTVTRVSGTCPQAEADGTNKASITIGSDDAGLYVLLPGIEGGCPATLDATTCRFKAECKIVDKADTSITLVTYNLDYTFSGKRLSGSLVGGAAAGVLAPDACDSTVKHEGTRL